MAMSQDRIETLSRRGDLFAVIGLVLTPSQVSVCRNEQGEKRGFGFYDGKHHPVRPGHWAFGFRDLAGPSTRIPGACDLKAGLKSHVIDTKSKPS
jgi:hypothetical protein